MYLKPSCINLHIPLVTGWRRLMGSPELQIIFHRRAIKYMSLLQKMTYEDKGSYEYSTPCMYLNIPRYSYLYI